MLQRRPNELPSIDGRPRPRNEAISGLNQTTVAVKISGHARTKPVRGLGRGIELKHQNDSSTACTTIWGLTAMSGCTDIMRKVCCTTSLKTGAATAPP